MRNLFSIFWFIGLLFSKNMQASPFPFNEVEEMVNQDDALRIRWIYEKDLAVKNEIAKEIRLQEIANTQKTEKIISHSGLPLDDDISGICKLILRSSDLNFQTNILKVILTLENKSWREWIPNLVDRILLRQGLSQRYGTHLRFKDDSYTPYPIENLEKVDCLREKFCNLPLQTYIAKIRQIYFAIIKNDKKHKQILFFNQNHNFYDNPNDYLYVILEEDGCSASTSGVSSAIAFEHPAHAAIYALRYQWDWNYELRENNEINESEESNHVICYEDFFEDYFFSKHHLFSEPCYVFLMPLESFQPFQFEDAIFNRIFIASENIKPVAKFVCDSFFDPLLTLEKEIKIEWSDGVCSQMRTYDPDSSSLCSFLFDITLENEDF